MSNDAKLQKLLLGPDWIDLSFGEPKVVMSALYRQLNRFGDPFKMPAIYDLPTWEYQQANGKPDLVKILEKKYAARVVICNGAKQALAASSFAFRSKGFKTVFYDEPFYPANPGITQSAGLIKTSISEADCLLITSPNNPDGKNYDETSLRQLAASKPMIHDAAYHTEIYLPDGQQPIAVGDIQVFSMSKMYGLSGLRIGYAVCHNEAYYKDMVNYMEMTTAGVSTASQDIARNIELMFRDNPSYYKEFVKEARESIVLSRKELEKLDPDVLTEVQPQCNGMFGWFKIGPAFDANAAKVYLLPGELFGQPGMVRMNLAYPPEVVGKAVSRLNAHKIRS